MKQLTILTAVHGRHVLARDMLLHARQTVPEGWALNIVAVLSPEDAEALGPDCDRVGIAWVTHQNLPLSKKWQHGLTTARQIYPDSLGVMIMGSDDFASPTYVTAALARLEHQPGQAFGSGNVWMFCRETEQVGLFEMMDPLKTLGAGRVFPRAVLDRLDWTLWTEDINIGLDNSSGKRCREAGFPVVRAELPGIVVDVKDSAMGNLHCWMKFMNWGTCPVTRFSKILPPWRAREFLRENGLSLLLREDARGECL